MEEEALAALERLGLTGYEARVYVALEKLQSATASEIAEVADVPRSQVYQTAATLEDRGFLEAHQANPQQYRVVPVAEIRRQFEEQFRTDTRRAFEYVESVQGSLAGTEDESPAEIWTVRGQGNVTKRIQHLLDEAQETVIYGVHHDYLPHEDEVVSRLDTLARAGADVTVLVSEATTVSLPESLSAVAVPQEKTIDGQTGRVLVVDETALLLSVVSTGGDETAIWSAETDFAHVLIRLVDGWVGDLRH